MQLAIESVEYIIQTTEVFDVWLASLMRSNRALGHRITQRIRRMSMGNLGDIKSLGERVFEARIFSTPTLRLYFTQMDGFVVILLCGGGKGSQQKDIDKAKHIAKQLFEEMKYELENL